MTPADVGDGPPPSFLVLMATRNGAAWVGAQLRTVLDQQAVTVRIRVGDDASTDGTAEIVRDAADRDGRIDLLAARVASGSACANFLRLIRSIDPADAGFTHVALCDQDDLWHPDKLHRAWLALARHGADLYSSAVTARWPSGRSRDLVQSAVPTACDHLFEGVGQGCTFVLTRALFERVRAVVCGAPAVIAPLRYHDWMIYALTRTWSQRWFYDPVPSMVYRQHALNDTGARGSAAGIILRMVRIASGWYSRQVAAVLAMCLHVEPGDPASTRVAELMQAARTSRRARWRWARFLWAGSRRRRSERALLGAFGLLGKL